MKTILETERLLLRELTPDDAAFAFELNSDPEVVRYTSDGPFDSEEQARTFLENYSDYVHNGYGRWGVVLKETNELLGWCGIKRDRETQEIDLGFRFFRRNWNKGYATEAASVCLDLGFNQLNMERIVGRAMKANTASARVLEKVGMRFVEEFEEDGDIWLLYEIVDA
jgi:[ribosomal protein S5]-alanine N-acetyltransferase